MRRTLIHLALVALALVVFWPGFIAGTRINSFPGNMVMLAAAGVLLGNIAWMYFTIMRRRL